MSNGEPGCGAGFRTGLMGVSVKGTVRVAGRRIGKLADGADQEPGQSGLFFALARPIATRDVT